MHSDPSQPSTAAAAYYARFSDGKSASSRDVSVQLGITGVEISVVAPDEMVIWPYESLKAGEPVRTHAIDVLLTSTAHPGASLFVPSADFARSLRDFAPHLTAHAERLRNARPWIIGAAVAAGLIAIIYAAGWSPIRSIASVLPASRTRLPPTVRVPTLCPGATVAPETAVNAAPAARPMLPVPPRVAPSATV